MICGTKRVYRLRLAGIAWLALSLIHTPLPWPDFHNVRHHDGPGEVCANHEHLLQWHPGATRAEDVALFHWHWFVPLEGESAPAQGHDGLSLHATALDSHCGLLCGSDEPSQTACEIVPAFHGVIRAITTADLLSTSSLEHDPPPRLGSDTAVFVCFHRSPSCAHALRSALLQRWTC